ncbi:MAG: hypothetical protein A3F42_04150 [Gammaproteobacteria bacterium RIFCSPHIGHO2_12_FULL_37_34]|nr:MAG: hypothetical protein A3F42_04150 [Gammaproteobacteria bacterium RIFCSPHIGHO2_12_FULL_37_34]
MRKKIILGFAIASMATSAFALEIYKGRLITHKEWTTGNAKGFFKASKMIPELKAKGLDAEHSYSYIYSYAASIKSSVNTPVNVSGENYISLYNDTRTKELYHYTFSVCARNSDHTAQCAYYYDEIELEPGGYANSAEQPILQVTFAKPGNYNGWASTSLSKDQESASVGSHSRSESTIEIS